MALLPTSFIQEFMISVLFLCVENACRSQIAEAICKNLYSHKILAYSAGSNPAKKINPKAIQSLSRINIAHSGEPKKIDFFKNYTFDYVITMGCGDVCPYVPNIKNIDWNIPDPKFLEEEQFDEIRDMIKSKIISELLV